MVAAGVVLALATTARAHAGAPVAASEPVSKQQDDKEENKDSPSPWLLVPTVSSNPKSSHRWPCCWRRPTVQVSPGK